MERFSLAGGQGWLTVEESGGRARCAAELPEDGKGLYKGYLCGTGGRALLGTFLPEDACYTVCDLKTIGAGKMRK